MFLAAFCLSFAQTSAGPGVYLLSRSPTETVWSESTSDRHRGEAGKLLGLMRPKRILARSMLSIRGFGQRFARKFSRVDFSNVAIKRLLHLLFA
jgi:hypothetical protein